MSEGRTEHSNGSWRGSVEPGNIRRRTDSSRNASDLHNVLWSCKEQQNTSFYSIFSLPDKSQLTSLYLLKCFSEASVGFNIETLTFSCFSDFSPEKMSLVISEISGMNSNVSHINPIKTFKEQMIRALISPLFL